MPPEPHTRLLVFPRTLRGRIGAAMGFFLLIASCAQLALVAYFWTRGAEEQIQSFQRGLAQEIARQVEPHIQEDGSVNLLPLQMIARQFQSFNGNISIYLLDAQGSIVLDLSDTERAVRRHVDLTPVRAQLENAENQIRLQRGTDPARPSGEVAFLAARLKLGESSGYVYVTLVNSRSGFFHTLLLERLSFRYVALGTMLIVCSSILLAALAARLITARFTAIVDILHRYSRGERDARIKDNRKDEVGEVAEAFNSMASAIESHVSELERKDALRRELILNVWHDLRSPLAVIGAQIQLLEMNDEAYDAVKRLTSYARIERSSELLNNLLEELHDLAKLETKETVPQLRACSPELLLRDIRERYSAKAEASEISLLVDGERDVPDVSCDPNLINRVLGNLIENALRYTPKHGTITLGLRRDGDGARISVADTGSGISSAAIGFIFERHFQVEDSASAKKGASGLGLAIVKRIIEAHGSEIAATSKEGDGAVFSFVLPFSPQDDASRRNSTAISSPRA